MLTPQALSIVSDATLRANVEGRLTKCLDLWQALNESYWLVESRAVAFLKLEPVEPSRTSLNSGLAQPDFLKQILQVLLAGKRHSATETRKVSLDVLLTAVLRSELFEPKAHQDFESTVRVMRTISTNILIDKFTLALGGTDQSPREENSLEILHNFYFTAVSLCRRLLASQRFKDACPATELRNFEKSGSYLIEAARSCLGNAIADEACTENSPLAILPNLMELWFSLHGLGSMLSDWHSEASSSDMVSLRSAAADFGRLVISVHDRISLSSARM